MVHARYQVKMAKLDHLKERIAYSSRRPKAQNGAPSSLPSWE